MTLFKIIAIVECDTLEQAQTVVDERFGYDEGYDDPETGQRFDYWLHGVNVEEHTP